MIDTSWFQLRYTKIAISRWWMSALLPWNNHKFWSRILFWYWIYIYFMCSSSRVFNEIVNPGCTSIVWRCWDACWISERCGHCNFQSRSFAPNESWCLTLSTDGESICEVQKTKFLGVIIDKKLTWKKEHIAFIAEKISGWMGMVIKARNFLNKEDLITVYYSFIYP